MRNLARFGYIPRSSLLLFLLLCCSSSLASDKLQIKTDYGTGILAGRNLLHYHHTCVYFSVAFVSGDFFTKFKVAKASTESVFLENGAVVRQFPETLTVYVRGFTLECPIVGIVPPDYASGLMAKAAFEAHWQRGDQERPATIVSTIERHHSPGWQWDYFLTIPAKDVPLTDVLVIGVSLRQGVSQVRLWGSVDPRYWDRTRVKAREREKVKQRPAE